jgi:restriction endonuclease S subunit
MKMLNLKDRDWYPFSLNSIFKIKPGKRLTKADMNQGKRPFIGATDSNNGITNFVSNANTSLDKGVLGVNYNGSVVETFYHPYECIFSDDVKRLRLDNALISNRFVYLFLKLTIVQQKEKYAYGYKFNEQRMNKQFILLPVVDADTSEPVPDWQFMNEYVKEREHMLVQRYVDYAKKIMNEICTEPMDTLKQKEWREFNVLSYFTPKRGRENDMSSLANGDTILISAKKVNNGLKSFVCVPDERLHDGHTITLNNDGDGGAGLAYYQPFPFALDAHVTSLRPNVQMSKYTLLFIASAITKQGERYGHGHSISDTRLRKIKIMLPVKSDDLPDWEYMDRYSKAITHQQLNEYLNCKKEA